MSELLELMLFTSSSISGCQTEQANPTFGLGLNFTSDIKSVQTYWSG